MAFEWRVLCRSRLLHAGFLAPGEHESLAAVVAGVVYLLPEAHKVIDGGDGGDQDSEVDCGDGNPLDGNDEHAEFPLEPPVSQNSGDHADNLDDRLELAQVAGLDGETFR